MIVAETKKQGASRFSQTANHKEDFYMYNFNFYMPTKVLFGPGKLNELHTEQLPGKKALIVTTNGQSVIKYGYLGQGKKRA